MRPANLPAAKAFAMTVARKLARSTTRWTPFAAAAGLVLIVGLAVHVAFVRPFAHPPPPAAAARAERQAEGAGAPLPTRPPTAVAVSTPVVAVSPAAAPVSPTQAVATATTTQVVVGRNDTLDAIFRRLSLATADLAAIRRLPGVRQALDSLRPGDALDIAHRDGSVIALTRRVSDAQTLHIEHNGTGFAARFAEEPVDTRIRTATATIDSSLFQAAESSGISEPVALELAAIFAWDIDFVLDIREGDRFTVEYQQIYLDGKYRRDGQVLAAEFVNDGKVFRAVRYVSESGAAGYYTPDGKPMRKAFLRAPVDFTRVSSVFNPHRWHPILNLIRGHMGTDYAAPIGTPVHAAADGRVGFEGWRGGYGNAIVLLHNNDISTLYGHMARFARGIHPGSRVQQGAVIGYVGMSGLATGPHLHYEYLVDGVHKDPQTVKLPGAEPLSAQALTRFRAQTASYVADLARSGAAPAPASAAATASTLDSAASAPSAAPALPSRAAPPAKPALPPRFAIAGASQYLGEARGAVD